MKIRIIIGEVPENPYEFGSIMNDCYRYGQQSILSQSVEVDGYDLMAYLESYYLETKLGLETPIESYLKEKLGGKK